MGLFQRFGTRLVLAGTCSLWLGACSGSPTTPAASSGGTTSPTGGTTTTTPKPVYVVLFTHIEDNTPAGTLGSPQARTVYLDWRNDLIAMGEAARRNGVPWILQPDWKFLEAARLYEDSSVTSTTGGRNLFRYLRDSLGVVIDPHSHENGGYNYTDVAYLLDQLGVGGSTVIGGHIWDPSLPQFAEWDRYRNAVAGQKYPTASWRGDILMGAGTPNHTNDPVVSGVWRPRDRNNFFTDDPSGNIVSIGPFSRDLDGVSTLWNLGKAGTIASSCILTSAYHIRPADIANASALAAVERDVIAPMLSLKSAGQVVLTDFSSLVSTWRTQYNAQGCVYRQ